MIGKILARGTITSNADRNAKTDLKPVNISTILDRVARLPIQQWRFKTKAGNVKHVGPMAQDFREAFGLGAQETAIATVDADGVALATIQGLDQKLEARLRVQQAELSDKDARISALEKQNAMVEDRLAALEKLVIDMTANQSDGSH